MWKYLEALNTNKFFIGVMMILLNIGSKYLVDEFSEKPDDYTRNIVLRRIAIFAVCFIATRDVVTSTVLTAGYIIIAMGTSAKTREGYKNGQQTAKRADPLDGKQLYSPYADANASGLLMPEMAPTPVKA
jgi:hypothetical protein